MAGRPLRRALALRALGWPASTPSRAGGPRGCSCLGRAARYPAPCPIQAPVLTPPSPRFRRCPAVLATRPAGGLSVSSRPCIPAGPAVPRRSPMMYIALAGGAPTRRRERVRRLGAPVHRGAPTPGDTGRLYHGSLKSCLRAPRLHAPPSHRQPGTVGGSSSIYFPRAGQRGPFHGVRPWRPPRRARGGRPGLQPGVPLADWSLSFPPGRPVGQRPPSIRSAGCTRSCRAVPTASASRAPLRPVEASRWRSPATGWRPRADLISAPALWTDGTASMACRRRLQRVRYS